MRKFTPASWRPVKNGTMSNLTGRLMLRLETPTAVRIVDEATGAVAILGYDHTFTADIPGSYTVIFDKAIEGYIHHREGRGREPRGEKFTNVDRQPNESGAVLETKRALRAFQLQQKQALDEIRTEREELRKERRKRRKEREENQTEETQQVAPVTEVTPEPEVTENE